MQVCEGLAVPSGVALGCIYAGLQRKDLGLHTRSIVHDGMNSPSPNTSTAPSYQGPLRPGAASESVQPATIIIGEVLACLAKEFWFL